MTSVGIDTSGRLVASYSNGDTKYVGQIAVTEFTNPAGLEKVSEKPLRQLLNEYSTVKERKYQIQLERFSQVFLRCPM